MILTEADTDFAKYYKSGSNVPLNFMFILDLNNKSSAADFKLLIDRWMNNIPDNLAYIANWVIGNHDNHRVASRFGEKRADQLSMLATILPGVSVIYNGDEIGMLDRNFTYEETKDPVGCIAGPNRYHKYRWIRIEILHNIKEIKSNRIVSWHSLKIESINALFYSCHVLFFVISVYKIKIFLFKLHKLKKVITKIFRLFLLFCKII